MTHDEMIELFKLISNGTDEEKSEAKDRLMLANAPLAVSIARQFLGRGLELEDLRQEASIGLFQAVNTFDYTKDFKFSTYATTCIENAIKRALARQADIIKIPARKYADLNKLKQVFNQFLLKFGRMPTVEEIAETMEVRTAYVVELLHIPQGTGSLDESIGEDGDTTLGDIIPNTTEPSPADIAFAHLLKEKMQEVLHSLTPLEEKVLHLRFGLDDDQPRKTAVVAAKLSMPEDRVYDITVKALRKLWHPSRAKKLTTRRRD